MVVKTSPSMTLGGLPVSPSMSLFNSPIQGGGGPTTMLLQATNNPAMNKGFGPKVQSRFFMRDKLGNRNAVEVCYFASSNVALAAYDHAKMVLSLTFKSKGTPVYEYYQVPRDYFEAMKRASSVGRFVYFSVRKRFHYRRVR